MILTTAYKDCLDYDVSCILEHFPSQPADLALLELTRMQVELLLQNSPSAEETQMLRRAQEEQHIGSLSLYKGYKPFFFIWAW